MKKLMIRLVQITFLSMMFFSSLVDAKVDINDENRVTLWHDLTIEAGKFYESVVVMLGSLDFYGETDELIVIGGSVHLREGSRVNNEVVVMGGQLQRDDGAYIGGETVNIGADIDIDIDADNHWAPPLRKFFWSHKGDADYDFGFVPTLFGIGVLIVIFSLGVLFIHLFPLYSDQAGRLINQHPVTSTVWGLASFGMFLPLGCIVLALSLIGIALIPLYLLFFVLLICCGLSLTALEVGKRLPVNALKQNEVLAMFVGMVIVGMLSIIPWLGNLVVFIMVCIGMGALTSLLFQRASDRRKKSIKVNQEDVIEKDLGEDNEK